ncbi:MAG TPA: hypothetical protein VKT74_03305 [Gammaproteobacteria bacterium]|nr:hypothetical protein [Gammaproteobacteria bacterium]
MQKKKTASRKKAVPKKGLVKRLAIKLGAAKKPARKKLAVKRIPAPLAAPQFAAPAAVKHGPLHLPSRPEPAYSIMHRRDWAHQPPPHKIPIPKR